MNKRQINKLNKIFDKREVFCINKSSLRDRNDKNEEVEYTLYNIQFFRFGDLYINLLTSSKEPYYKELKEYLDNLVKEFQDE